MGLGGGGGQLYGTKSRALKDFLEIKYVNLYWYEDVH